MQGLNWVWFLLLLWFSSVPHRFQSFLMLPRASCGCSGPRRVFLKFLHHPQLSATPTCLPHRTDVPVSTKIGILAHRPVADYLVLVILLVKTEGLSLLSWPGPVLGRSRVPGAKGRSLLNIPALLSSDSPTLLHFCGESSAVLCLPPLLEDH